MSVHKNCHLICVTGGKGGVGKSIFSANLAIALQSELKAQTLLIDLDQKTCGDQNIILGARPEKSISDLNKTTQALSDKTLKNYFTRHNSGLHYLAGVVDPSQELYADPIIFLKQLPSISQHYKYIVADLGNDLSGLQLKILEQASVALTITTPEILTVNQTKKFLTDMVSQTFPIDLFQIVINRVNSQSLDPNAISKSLGRPIVGMIPLDDATVLGSLQRNQPFTYTSPRSAISQSYFNIVRKLTGQTLQKLRSINTQRKTPTQGSSPASTSGSKAKASEIDSNIQLKIQIHGELIKELDLKKDLSSTDGDPQKEKELRQKTQMITTKLVDKFSPGLAREDRSLIIKQILDEALGLGALEELLADKSVSEIMVNGADKIFIEKNGKVQLSTTRFTSNTQLRNIIERIVTPLGRRIDEQTPYCDARLKDGSRVNAVIEPLAIDGPALTIRKFSKDVITWENYLKWGSMNKQMVDFLRICVENGLNVIISGGTGSGKTTLLNTLSGFIPANERIVTVEDAAELQLKQEHVVRLETKPANMEGKGEITIRDLVRNSLRMRPDRVIVGECRDGAALDMLQAMNTGHDGSMTTVHANTPREAISRLETLCLMAGMDLPAKAIREQIAGAVDLFVQIGRLSDGSRKVKYITEVGQIRGEVIELTDIFVFKEEGFDKNKKILGSFRPTGQIPKAIEKLEAKGVNIPRDIFTNTSKEDKEAEKASTSKVSQLGPRKKTPLKTKSKQVEKKKVSGGEN